MTIHLRIPTIIISSGVYSKVRLFCSNVVFEQYLLWYESSGRSRGVLSVLTYMKWFCVLTFLKAHVRMSGKGEWGRMAMRFRCIYYEATCDKVLMHSGSVQVRTTPIV